MKAIISVSNVVASVGKTTIGVHLAAEFSRRGHQTLLIDADPRADATSFFLGNEQITWTLADTLCPPPAGTRINFGRWDVFAPSGFTNLFIVPSSIRLATFDGLELWHVTDLKTRLEMIKQSYEFIVIDTPSSLALLTQTCLRASTHVLGVASPRGQSKAGVRLLANHLGDMPCSTQPILLGIVCNNFDCRSHESGVFYEELKEEWDGLLYETIIHSDSAIEQSAERHELLLGTRPGLYPAADLYRQLADEVLLSI